MEFTECCSYPYPERAEEDKGYPAVRQSILYIVGDTHFYMYT